MIMRQTKIGLSCLVITTALLITGCDMNKVIDKEIDKGQQTETNTKTENTSMSEATEASEKEEISDSQKEKLDALETQTAEEAVEEMEKEKLQEGKKVKVSNKKGFTDLAEFTMYAQAMYYNYHAGNLNGKEFYESIEPHLSADMELALPKDEELRLTTFEKLQEATKEYIKSPLVDYEYTVATYDERNEYAYSLRKYKLKNEKYIYYKLQMIKEDGYWKIIDDKQTEPYIKIDEQYEFKESVKID